MIDGRGRQQVQLWCLRLCFIAFAHLTYAGGSITLTSSLLCELNQRTSAACRHASPPPSPGDAHLQSLVHAAFVELESHVKFVWLPMALADGQSPQVEPTVAVNSAHPSRHYRPRAACKAASRAAYTDHWRLPHSHVELPREHRGHWRNKTQTHGWRSAAVAKRRRRGVQQGLMRCPMPQRLAAVPQSSQGRSVVARCQESRGSLSTRLSRPLPATSRCKR